MLRLEVKGLSRLWKISSHVPFPNACFIANRISLEGMFSMNGWQLPHRTSYPASFAGLDEFDWDL